jgi:hypothetical protein
MADFDLLLKKTLAVVNENYDIALSSVRNVVEQLGNAITSNAGDEFALEMYELASDIKGSVHRVQLDPDVNDDSVRLVVITYLQIPSSGFPIRIGRYSKSTGFFPEEMTLEDAEDVERYFARFLEDPNSKLIQAIGFALRLKSKRNESNVSGGDDPE